MSGVVELRLRQPVTLRYAAWPWTVQRVAISLEEPEAFLNALRDDALTAREAVIPASVE